MLFFMQRWGIDFVEGEAKKPTHTIARRCYIRLYHVCDVYAV